jgi:hypothetical protein
MINRLKSRPDDFSEGEPQFMSLKTVCLCAALTLFAIGAVGPVLAAPLTYLASYGSGATCTRSAPCSDFTLANNATDAGGEIVCLDAGPYTLDIEIGKSLTINCPGGIGNVIGFGTTGTNSAQVVRIYGMTFVPAASNYDGIQIYGGDVLFEDCRIENFPNVPGLLIQASSYASTVTIKNSTIWNNVKGNISIQAQTATMSVVLDHTTVAVGLYGVRADGSTGSSQIDVEVRDSFVGHHTNNGVLAVSNAGQAPIHFKVTRSTLADNGVYGAVATGAQAFMIVDGSSLTKNGTGLAQLSGSTVATYGNNGINFNTTQTSGTITPITLK